MSGSLGVIDVQWNGTTIDVEKGASIRLAAYKNNPVPTGRKVYAAQEFQGGEAKATAPLPTGSKLSAGTYLPGGLGELQVTLDTGSVITSSDAFLQEAPTATGGEGGKLALTWTFSTYTEI